MTQKPGLARRRDPSLLEKIGDTVISDEGVKVLILGGAGLTLVSLAQDKPRWIIFGGGVFTVFSAFVAGFDMAGDRPEFYELLYEDCKKQGYWTDEDGVRLDSKEGPLAHLQSSSNVWVSTGPDICETEFNGASAFFYASAATLAYGLYRASEKGL